MYSDRKQNAALRAAVWLAAVLLAVAAAVFAVNRSESGIGEESAAAIRETVSRRALQCYAVEGVYPPDLAYLENNYGLSINRKDFYVTYDAFASNLPPTVIVTPRR